MLARLAAAFTTWCFLAATLQAEIKPYPLFSDNAVFQRDKPLIVWGIADPGEDITPVLEGPDVPRFDKTIFANSDGSWRITLPPLKAGGPYTLILKSRNGQVRINNFLVGEVWLCAGESNMEWPLATTQNGPKHVSEATNPTLRLLTIPKVIARAPSPIVDAKWIECTPETAASFSAVAYFFGRELQKTLKVPIGLINASWGGTVAEAWTSEESLLRFPDVRGLVDAGKNDMKRYLLDCERYLRELDHYAADARKLMSEGKELPSPAPPPIHPSKNPNVASALYNGMIAPLTPFPIRGIVWYQGESNTPRAFQYRTLLTALIQDWRAQWKQPDLPFLIVQLAPWRNPKPLPEESEWAELRESQLLASKKNKNTGLIVITDAGDSADLHPRKKEPVGARLAVAARAIAYGETITCSGPMLSSYQFRDDQVILMFDSLGSGLEARGGPLTGFSIIGKNGRFMPAKAEIVGDTVVVSSPDVQGPLAVRYGWASYPTGNLYNKSGLPASPFRTDDFPLLTQPK